MADSRLHLLDALLERWLYRRPTPCGRVGFWVRQPAVQSPASFSFHYPQRLVRKSLFLFNMYFSSFISGAVLFHLSIAGYVLEDDYAKDFYSKFDFFTASDPTHGK